jgi:hypothetical protein
MGNSQSGKKSKGKGGDTLKSSTVNGKQQLLSNYDINSNTKMLGQGAFGRVYLTKNKHQKDF